MDHNFLPVHCIKLVVSPFIGESRHAHVSQTFVKMAAKLCIHKVGKPDIDLRCIITSERMLLQQLFIDVSVAQLTYVPVIGGFWTKLKELHTAPV